MYLRITSNLIFVAVPTINYNPPASPTHRDARAAKRARRALVESLLVAHDTDSEPEKENEPVASTSSIPQPIQPCCSAAVEIIELRRRVAHLKQEVKDKDLIAERLRKELRQDHGLSEGKFLEDVKE